MDLKTEPTFQWNLFVWFGKVNRLIVVEPNLNSSSFGANDQLVPLTLGPDVFLKFLLRCLGEHFATTRFVVQKAPNRTPAPTSYVALIADHLMAFRYPLAAELDTGVVALANKFGLEAQLEVAVFLVT